LPLREAQPFAEGAYMDRRGRRAARMWVGVGPIDVGVPIRELLDFRHERIEGVPFFPVCIRPIPWIT
jgi:hypothetical protein